MEKYRSHGINLRSAEIRQNGGHFERAIDRPLNLLKHRERVNFGWVAPLFGALSRIESNVAYAGSEFSRLYRKIGSDLRQYNNGGERGVNRPRSTR